MMQKRFATLVLSCLMVLASCDGNGSKDDSADDSDWGSNPKGGSELCENIENIPCQSGFRCTTPTGVGAFVCTERAGLPPRCIDYTNHDFGPCTQVEGQGYCMQSCGPKPVDQCLTGSVCSAMGSGFVCAPPGLSSPPSCSTESCPCGECLLSYDADRLCMKVESASGDYAV